MPTLVLPSKNVHYQIKYSSKRKTISIGVDKENGLTVSAPEGTSLSEVDKLLKNKQSWIIDKLNVYEEILPPPRPKEFVSGERLTYIGRSYRLRVNKTQTKEIQFQLFRGRFETNIPNDGIDYSNEIRAATIKWFKARSLDKIQSRIDFYAPKVGEFPINIRVKEFKTRWGTCQQDISIDFNWKIIIAPMSIIDYVVVHELCHLVAKSHSKKFWSKLSAIIIDHEKRKDWLRINGATLTI